MSILVSRRRILKSAFAATPIVALPAYAQAPPAPTPPAAFPRHPPDLVQETVVVAHTNFKRVKEIVDRQPAMARAAVDWGFGDWEDALGAASHMGNRQIAEYLIANGARPTIFSAAMLGQLDVVKAFVAASPGVQRIPGPHSFSLLFHAKAGGPAAAAVYSYLESLGDAGSPKTEPISDAEKASLVGDYMYDGGKVRITVEQGQLAFAHPGMPFGRTLLHLGSRVFFPAGAAAVRIRFIESAAGMTLIVNDGDLVLAGIKRGA
jgi:hypothetical protein